jgi:sulfur-oxidizing protein SoxY
MRVGILSLLVLCWCLPLAAQQTAPAQSPVDVWESLLRPHYFPNVTLIEDQTVIKLATPYRSEDAAFTPVRVQAMMPQDAKRYIQTLYLFVDDNPEPAVGVFHFTPASGSADLALRVRIDKYTYVRAVAVLNNGEHHMVKNFVKAQGGCAIPVAIDYTKAMSDLGKIQLRTLATSDEAGDIATQLQVHHPNFSGMQMDFKIYAVRPAHYVQAIRVLLNGAVVMSAETGIAVSADPSLRFFLKPHAKGELKAEIEDSKGNKWSESLRL